MESMKFWRGQVAPLDVADVDTDQIIPKQFLKRVERTGFGKFLFYNWRYDYQGKPIENFVLNKPFYSKASILLTRKNFGTGSSREHAVWALMDFGFKVVISPKFGEIFYNNALKNCLLVITLSEEKVDQLFKKTFSFEKKKEPYYLSVDLVEQVVYDDSGFKCSFDIDPFRKMCLVEGLDEIALTLRYESKIQEYETKRKERFPFREFGKV
ncbi:MAG: 3-isopropylmalate dehydratase small subunit [Candidatus Calescibacterium sp.]|nr:3-isopropylmalate dehydratase small subunit [Candidatus Calescibacterium sp.]MCX7733229.1 3-isopropylmalate dehydratase small subunit [bacterium]MDW8086936.1 3-isopropylmalate dehydratase small subunit [Candidatus Calescibacterium sp.]